MRPSPATPVPRATKSSSISNSITTSPQTLSTPSPRSTLVEVLRNNPFRGKEGSKDGSPDASTNTTINVNDGVKSLNADLQVIANFYPDVKLEVCRELLLRLEDGGDSRLQICIEQLYRYKNDWAKGRFQVPPRDIDEPLSREETFRSQQYHDACLRTLCKELTSLNRSAVEGVLAEVNYSYNRARPVLQEISAQTWKATFTSLFRKKRSLDEIPSFMWERGKTGLTLASTGSSELDEELKRLFLDPAKAKRDVLQEERDREYAMKLNHEEAEEARALFECQVCYNEVSFENVATCTTNTHVICLDCVRRSLHEAIFGQGWAQSIDAAVGTLRCIAPVEECNGHIIPSVLERVVFSTEKAGAELWAKFEDRLAEQDLLHSRLPIVRCPFCNYAEASDPFDMKSARSIRWHWRRRGFNPFFLSLVTDPVATLVSILFSSLFLLCLLVFFFLSPSSVRTLFYTALLSLAQLQQASRFICRRPSCRRKSCLKCQRAWHDPHVCHEPLLLSLRQSVEAARTSAIKRICPRCGTGFVKSSGCNKLTCVCGYSMCYLCRKNIGKTGENEGGKGYRHYCEHFRPVPGQKCTECDKCDLYKAEDEDATVRRAGERAEKEWREREGLAGNLTGLKGVPSIDHANLAGNKASWWNRVGEIQNWTIQGAVDWIVERTIVVDL